MRFVQVSALVATLACGTPSQTVSIAPTPSSNTNPAEEDAKRLDAARERARQIIGAAVELRGRVGSCPTIANVLDKYNFAPGAELDVDGKRFIIECTDDEVRVVATDHRVMHAQQYTAPSTSTAIDSPTSDQSTSARVSTAERVIAGIRPRFRSCYQQALSRDPNMSGTVHGRLIIAADGAIKDVAFDKATTTSFDAPMLTCLKRVIQSASHEPGNGVEQTIAFCSCREARVNDRSTSRAQWFDRDASRVEHCSRVRTCSSKR